VAVVDETVHGGVAPSKVEGLILGFQIEQEREERLKQKDASRSSGNSG
jgi:NADH-quinone oxidoreductase subunit E